MNVDNRILIDTSDSQSEIRKDNWFQDC